MVLSAEEETEPNCTNIELSHPPGRQQQQHQQIRHTTKALPCFHFHGTVSHVVAAVPPWVKWVCLHMTWFLSTAQFVNCWFACSLFFHRMLSTKMCFCIYLYNLSVWLCVLYGCYNAQCINTIFHRPMCFVSFISLRSVFHWRITKLSKWFVTWNMDRAKSFSSMNVNAIQSNSDKREYAWRITTKTAITNQYRNCNGWLTENAFYLNFHIFSMNLHLSLISPLRHWITIMNYSTCLVTKKQMNCPIISS